jgi:hypothetical protein
MVRYCIACTAPDPLDERSETIMQRFMQTVGNGESLETPKNVRAGTNKINFIERIVVRDRVERFISFHSEVFLVFGS